MTAALPGVFGAVAPLLDHYGYLAVGGLIFVEDFGVPAPGETILIAAALYAGAGRLDIVAVAVIAFLARPRRRCAARGVIFGAFGLRGVVDLVLATVSVLPAAFGALIGYGLGTSTGNVTFSSALQSHVRGRVFSAFDLICAGHAAGQAARAPHAPGS